MKLKTAWLAMLVATSTLALAACGSAEPEATEDAMADTATDGAAMDAAAAESAAGQTSMPAPEGVGAPGPMASIAMINATCPGDIAFHADDGGPAYINGEEADVAVSNENYYEATGGGVTVSVSSEAGANPSVSYTGAGGANGICTIG